MENNRRVSDRRQADKLAQNILLQLESIRSILSDTKRDCIKKIELADGQHILIELTLQNAKELAQLQLVNDK